MEIKLIRNWQLSTVRLKHNFWGNDGESRTALGIIPYVTFLKGSTRKNVRIAGIPFSFDITENLGLGAQAQFDFLPSDTGNEDDNKLSYLQTLVLGGKLIGNLDFYAEGMIIFFEQERFVSANGGFIYNVSDNVKIDIAANMGLTQGNTAFARLPRFVVQNIITTLSTLLYLPPGSDRQSYR